MSVRDACKNDLAVATPAMSAPFRRCERRFCGMVVLTKSSASGRHQTEPLLSARFAESYSPPPLIHCRCKSKGARIAMSFPLLYTLTLVFLFLSRFVKQSQDPTASRPKTSPTTPFDATIDSERLSTTPSRSYKKTSADSSVPTKATSLARNDSRLECAGKTCTVCLSDYACGERLCRLPCLHVFHAEVR